MPAEEVAFRVAYEGPLTEFSRRNPAAVLALWCDWRREVVQVTHAGREEVDALRRKLREHSSYVDHHEVGDATHILVMDCVNLPHDFVNEAVDESRCVHVPPTRFEDRWEHYRVVSFSEEQTRALFQRVRDGGREVELLSKRRLSVQPLLNTRSLAVDALLEGLTDRQLEALVLAARHGMYESPRRTTAASIADAVGLSRSTFEEHLRKAENRIFHDLVPYLELAHRSRKPR